jgi:hypothetical protein
VLDEVDHLVRKTTKTLRKLDKEVKFDPKNKKFSVSKKKSIKNMDCYNCGELGHLAHQNPLPDKRKHKNHKKDGSDHEKEKKPNNKFKSKKKNFNKYKKGAKSYVSQWINNDELNEKPTVEVVEKVI